VGVSPDTLRLYERKGLLHTPLRSANGYRSYSADCVARVRLIRAALSIGFTLDELARILKIRDSGGVPCNRVRDLTHAKLQGLEQHIQQVIGLRDQLREVLRTWDRTLKQTPRNKTAGLLEALASSSPPKTQTLPPHLYATLAKENAR
jgi:DNA-binding transcriptional MerR regulator